MPGLHKVYGSLEGVAGVDVTIAWGELFGLLGPNGAGKTAIVAILEGQRSRSGEIVHVRVFESQAGGGLRPGLSAPAATRAACVDRPLRTPGSP